MAYFNYPDPWARENKLARKAHPYLEKLHMRNDVANDALDIKEGNDEYSYASNKDQAFEKFEDTYVKPLLGDDQKLALEHEPAGAMTKGLLEQLMATLSQKHLTIQNRYFIMDRILNTAAMMPVIQDRLATRDEIEKFLGNATTEEVAEFHHRLVPRRDGIFDANQRDRIKPLIEKYKNSDLKKVDDDKFKANAFVMVDLLSQDRFVDFHPGRDDDRPSSSGSNGRFPPTVDDVLGQGESALAGRIGVYVYPNRPSTGFDIGKMVYVVDYLGGENEFAPIMQGDIAIHPYNQDIRFNVRTKQWVMQGGAVAQEDLTSAAMHPNYGSVDDGKRVNYGDKDNDIKFLLSAWQTGDHSSGMKKLISRWVKKNKESLSEDVLKMFDKLLST